MNTQRRISSVLAFILMVSVGSVWAQSQKPDPGVDLIWGAKIPLRDGVRINATIFKSKTSEKLPVIFTLTPYIADSYQDRALYFARNGYVFALVDVRGRGNSEGKFEPFASEARDGHDVVEWLARQPWSNGKVTMWGGSYAGFDQWATLKEAPPHLATIVPAAAAYAGVDFPFFKNIFASYDIQWLSFTSGVTPNAKLFGESSIWNDKFRELYLAHRPFKELDQVVGNTLTHFQTWLEHPTPDEYWQAMVPTPDQYKRMTVPILSITGHYDGDQAGAMTYYREHMRYGSDEAKQKHFLIIGPWDHAGTRTPNRDVGGLKFGEASMLDLNKLHKEWYDWTMKGGPKPEFLRNRVAYYVVGAEVWKYANSLDTIANTRRTLYLSSDGNANDVFRSGALSEERPRANITTHTGSSNGQSAVQNADHYTYDPLDVRPAELEREDAPNYLLDQRSALNLYGNGVVYHSEPFAEDTEVTGNLKFVAWVSMDVPDTDFQVSVYEIKQDGASVLLTEDMMRARYRESLTKQKLVKPGEINRSEFNGFTFFSRRIGKGSRLRLLVRSPNSIGLEKNYNSGGVVAEESAKDARRARITLYHDAEHLSFLEIPIVK